MDSANLTGSHMVPPATEIDRIRQRFERRKQIPEAAVYDPTVPSVYVSNQERERVLIRWIRSCGIAPVKEKRVLEVGCGTGGKLLELLRLGFQPENLLGNELREECARIARHRLPAATQIIVGDASELPLQDGQIDVVYQSTVFTSILDDSFQHRLADRMWALARPGGGILWYDFRLSNPKNSDVRGVGLRRIRELFPRGNLTAWRLTLADPISRRVCAVHPALYTLFNALPLLRTHLLCWIKK